MSRDREPSDSDPDDVFPFEREFDEESNIALAIIEAVASIENTTPAKLREELGVALYDTIDPTALAAIVGDGSGAGERHVEFPFATYRIRITDGGKILIFERER